MQEEQKREPFSFSGQGSEYFRIWIVNLCLTIVTLGIYSAWAKVRRLQYFYRHTSVAGASLDYHGNPIAILKGRIVALILFGGYSIAGQFSPMIALAVFALIMAVMPWLVVRSLRFRLHNTSYRGLRFSFRGKTGDGYVNFLLLPLASYLSLGFLWPLAHQQITRYTRDNSRYGDQPFKFSAKAGKFYKPYMVLFGIFLLFIAIVGVIAAIIYSSGLARHLDSENSAAAMMAIFGVIGVFYLLLFLFATPYITSRLQNLIWNNTTLGTLGFESALRARDLFWILLSNVLLIIVTLGLFKPFADIRMMRYKIERMALLANDDLDTFIADREAEVSAIGEESADIFDMDIAL